MSEINHYKGTLKKVNRFTGETLEEQCKRLLEDKKLLPYYNFYSGMLVVDLNYQYIVHDGILYEVDKKELGMDTDICIANRNLNGNIDFEVRFYNGSSSFGDAIEEALKNIEVK